jgi:hypothetical protein
MQTATKGEANAASTRTLASTTKASRPSTQANKLPPQPNSTRGSHGVYISAVTGAAAKGLTSGSGRASAQKEQTAVGNLQTTQVNSKSRLTTIPPMIRDVRTEHDAAIMSLRDDSPLDIKWMLKLAMMGLILLGFVIGDLVGRVFK